MKIVKTLSLFLFIVVLAGFVSANVDVTYNFIDAKTRLGLSDVDGLVMTCGDALCTGANIKTPNFPNIGNSDTKDPITDLIITFPAVQETPSGYAVYFYKSGYLPLEGFITEAWGNYTAQRTVAFSKKDVCSAQIDNFQIINVAKPNIPLVINMRASLDATTHSAFATNLNTPYYTPPQYIEDFYSAQTKIELNIYDSKNNVVFSQQKTVNIQADKSVDVSFTWTPTKAGDYKAVISTDVTDDQCASSQKQESTKIFEVLGEEPKSSCYTILNNLRTSNDKPSVNEKLTITANKISNLASPTGELTPVTTQVIAQIFRESALVYSNALNLPKNPDAATPKDFSFEFTPDRVGIYTITLNGVANDKACLGLKNIDDTITQTFFVQKPFQATLEIKPIETKEVYENQRLTFGIQTTYTGNLPLKYTVAVPNDVGPYSFDSTTQRFTITPSYDAVVHLKDQNVIATLKEVIVSMLGLSLHRDIIVTFHVTDGQISADRTTTIRITDVNRDPELEAIQDKIVQAGQKITIVPVATDPDGDKVTFTFTSPLNSDGSWTPKESDIGKTYDIIVRAYDAFGGVALTTFKITVTGVPIQNHAPVLSKISDKKVQEQTKLEFTLHATDIDNDPLTFFAQSLPAGATLNTDTGKFSWTPTHDQIGTHNVTFGVTDGKAQDRRAVKIKVTQKGVVPPTPAIELIGSHKVDIMSIIIINDPAVRGKTQETFVYVKNIGSKKEKGVVITLTIPEFGIVQQKTLDLLPKQEQLLIFDTDIPSNTLKGEYTLYISAYDKTSQVVRAEEFKVL